jgi:UDP-N-acetylmuramoylalanine--D-glutamate ligase
MRALLVGFGVTNRAVADAMIQRGHEVIVADDAPNEVIAAAARERNLTLVERPDADTFGRFLDDVDLMVPSPGLGDVHPSIQLAHEHGVPIRSEFDLAADWDQRPVLAITGTDGKTTVTTLTTSMLQA